MTGSSTVWAVVVSYHPDPDPLECLLTRLAPQVDRIVVVDDGSPEPAPIEALCRQYGQVEFHAQGFNGGLARAQNAGIRRALAAGAGQVILFDQDSEPAPDLVARLQTAIETLGRHGVRVGAVGANYDDDTHTPFRRIRGPWIRHCECRGNDRLPRVDYLIASGCLIPVDVLRAVGEMNEALFIDYVDTEWSLRAAAAGYSLYGVCDARMRHRLGDDRITLSGRPVALHSPLRHYYMFRNALWLYRQSGLSRRWKLADAIRLIARFFIYALAGPARMRQIRAMLRGLADGLHGRLACRLGTLMADRAVPDITVSVVSHGHGAMVSELLADLANLPEIARCVLTLNVPEPGIVVPERLNGRIVWRRNAHPLGFGANHNRAFADCDTAYYCIINPDVRITVNPFPALLAALQQEQAALAAPAILSPEGRLEDSVRRFPTFASLVAKALFGRDGRYGFAVGDASFSADWVGGMCMLLRRDAFTAAQGFDENFFLYYEDVDLCARLGQQGWRVFAVPAASVVHNARRDSHRKLRYLGWHLSSLLRYLARRTLGRYRSGVAG